MPTKITVCWTEDVSYRTTITLDDYAEVMREQGYDPARPSDIRAFLNDDDAWIEDVDLERDFHAVNDRDVDEIVVDVREGS